MSDLQEVIQAFVDGEPVDPVELDRALADPEGRAHLIDVVVLRKLVKRSSATVPPVVVDAAPPARRALRWLAAAAAVVIVASVGGYLIGQHASARLASDGTSASGPPSVDAPAVPPPAPTVVIRFQPGVDWTERGGH
jgi:hypothetical protein